MNRPLYEGGEGVIIGFPERNNFKLYEGDAFTVALRLENDGATHIEAPDYGYVSVLYDPSAVSLRKVYTSVSLPRSNLQPAPFALKGREVYVSQGEVDFPEFTFSAMNVTGNREKFQTQLNFQVCYPYETILIHDLCVESDIYYTTATQTCQGGELRSTSQGAPIAVTLVEPSYLRNGKFIEPRFRITFQNLQDGYTLWNDTQTSAELCSQSDFDYADFGRIQVSASLSDVPLVCGSSGNGVTRFEDKTAQVICRLTGQIEAQANYVTPLIVEANYIYIDSVKADIEVNKG